MTRRRIAWLLAAGLLAAMAIVLYISVAPSGL
jgi:hypothetical protein